MSNVVYVNVEDGAKRVMNNTKLYAKLLDKFKQDQTFNELITVLAQGDIDKAQSASHTFKGLTANLSLSELYKQCVELEAQTKTGSVNPEQVEIVKNAYNETLKEIDKVISQYV